MATTFYKMHCVYCLKLFEELTSDHVFPKSWYPETTPENLEKWQMPACVECNQEKFTMNYWEYKRYLNEEYVLYV